LIQERKVSLRALEVLDVIAGSCESPARHLMWNTTSSRSLIESLERDVRLGRLHEFVAYANRLSSTLRNHIYKEDTILFEEADSLLNPQQDDICFEQLNGFETALDKQVLEQASGDSRSRS
jgi:hemerythrin-like domain-containing protein